MLRNKIIFIMNTNTCRVSALTFSLCCVLSSSLAYVDNRNVETRSVQLQNNLSSPTRYAPTSDICHWTEWILINHRIQPYASLRSLVKDVLQRVNQNECPVQIEEMTEHDACLDFIENAERIGDNFLDNNIYETCPILKNDNLQGLNDTMLKRAFVIGNRFKRSGIWRMAERQDTCVGSLLIKHDSNNGIVLDDFSLLRLRDARFPRLKPLQRREIIQIVVDGNCRWKLFSRRGFHGDSRIISATTNYLPFHPESVLKIDT